MVTGADESEQARERVERERLPAAQAAPDLPERVGGGDRLRPRRDERAVERAGRGPDDQVRRDAALVEGVEHPDLDGAEPGSAREDEGDGGSAARCHHPGLRRPGARCYASPAPTGRTQTQLFVSGPTRSLRAGPNSASTSRRPSRRDVLPGPWRAEAPVAPPRPRRQPVRERQQRVRLDRERARRRLDEPAPRDAPELGGERGPALARDVLDHARGVGEVELAVGERQALGGVGLHERAGVLGARREVDAGDVEVRLEGAQAERAAADVDDPHAGPDAGRARRSARGACGGRSRRAARATRARSRPRAVA